MSSKALYINSDRSVNKIKRGWTIILTAFFVLASCLTFIILTNQSNKPKDNLVIITPTPSNDSSDNPIIQQSYPQRDIKLLFTGDNMLALSIGDRIKSGENIYANIRNELLQYDFIIINLETNISQEGVGKPNRQKNWRFNAPIETLDLLNQNSINVVNLANNHTMDYQEEGLTNQIDLLDSYGIKHFGAGKNEIEAFSPLLIELLGTKISLLGFNDVETLYSNAAESEAGTAYFDKTKNQQQIKTAKENSDIVIVSGHSGTEGNSKSNSRQQEYYKFFIDSGADLIIGHHPHVTQEVADYNGKMIYYSLGNFVFETGERALYKKAIAVEVIIDSNSKEIKQINTINVQLENGIPKFIK